MAHWFGISYTFESFEYFSSSMATIELKNTTIFQGNHLVLSNVSFKINTGEFVYLIGQTGSGKSSLLKTLYGDLPLNEGTGEVAGHQLNGLKTSSIPALRRDIGIVFQDFQLLSDRSVEANLDFVLRATGWKDKAKRSERIIEVLSLVGMQNKRHKSTFEISGGEQQRVAIARALLNAPKVILADEPTGNLDPRTSEEIMSLLLSLADQNTAILMATHDYQMIHKYSNRTLKVSSGKLEDSVVSNV
jgi:cell division transport system ATP-binding protein